MSFHSESESSSENNANPKLQEERIQAEGAPSAPGAQMLVPLENHRVARLTAKDERVLRNNYDITSSTRLHFQDPATRTINGGEVTIFERMLMAGLQFPFPAIASELQLFLMVAPSQILSNGWRYLFASCILWRTVLDCRMTIPQFFNIYRLSARRDGTIEFQVRQNLIFIWIFQQVLGGAVLLGLERVGVFLCRGTS
jgi:hypothetical protein